MYSSPHQLLVIDNVGVYFSASYTPDYQVFALIKPNDPFYDFVIWSKMMTSTTDSSNSYVSDCVYDSNNRRIYNNLIFGINSLIFSIDLDSGSYAGTGYYCNSCNSAFDMILIETHIYLLYD